MEGSCAVFTVVTTKVSDDRYSYGEQHFVTFGLLQGLTVVYTKHEDWTRIISAIKATEYELYGYADSLNVGSDLLSGTGLSRYVAIRKIVELANSKNETAYDFVLVDLPPSFGSLVRAAFYSSDFYIVPCTSDSFSVYCLGLIGQMVPNFMKDWQSGLQRFKDANPHFTDFDKLGKPVFAGWVFNGFDTARKRRSRQEIENKVPQGEKEMIQADETMHNKISNAVDELSKSLIKEIVQYHPVANINISRRRIGDIEDANVLIQNSLWLNVPLGELEGYEQVSSLQDRKQWAHNQIEQIQLLKSKFSELADNIMRICV